MQLSKLEIKGFKSFGDKITINFDQGITGIVGPNGCGKSNVVDSIRWVLGEQRTRALRSDKMENIIFNGTRNRKSLQMAEVSITFNNTKNLLPTEYTQVTITRRYYRTGESEYQLNGVTCRLKDINDLFLDTGIGPDSYAIIELKMVDDILNDKDNSRRELFEEAAGISKFKIRKKQTLKKLEDTDNDLARVDDLLFEIEKNLKSLEKQAKQAEKYFQIKDEYKLLSIDLAKLTVSKFKESFDQVNKQLQTEKDKKTALDTQLLLVDAETEKLKAEIITKEKLVASRQKALNEHINNLRQYESEKKIKNERLRFLSSRSTQLVEQIEQDKKSNERAEFSIKSLSEESKSLEKQLAELETYLEIIKNEADIQKTKANAIQEEHTLLNAQLKEKQEKVHQLSKSVEIAQVQLVTLQQELERTHSDTSQQYAGMADFEGKIAQLSASIENKSDQLEDLRERETTIQENISDLEVEVEEIKDKIARNSRVLDAKQNEFNLTKSLVDNLEGFPEAVKFLKKNVEWTKNAPLLSDVLTCEEKYRIVIENYLEPFMNFYILDKQEHATQAIDLLSNSAKGKANFFVLSNFKNYIPTVTRQLDNCFTAISIVEYDEKYLSLISYLLDGVYIYKGADEQLPDKHDGVFITESGKIIKRKYSISGGSVGLFEGKRIGRAKNLEKLEKDIATMTSEMVNIRQSITKKQTTLAELRLSTKKLVIETLQSEITLLNNELITYQTKKEQFSKLLLDSNSKKEDLQDRINSLQEEVNNFEPSHKQEQELLNALVNKIEAITDEVVIQKQLAEQKTSLFNQENINSYQLGNKYNGIVQELGFKQSTYETSKDRIAKSREELTKIEDEIKLLVETAEDQDDTLVELYKEKEAIEQGLAEAEKAYYATRGAIDLLEKDAKETQKQRETADVLIMEFNNKLNESVLNFTSVKERLSVEFQVDIDEILANEGEELQLSPLPELELKSKVEHCRASLEKIGPINPMAMEAYNEIKERHTFITDQKNDLVLAKTSLMQTIYEIDIVAKQTFNDAFIKIRENFILVFRSLFSDQDSCDLKLINPENPTESAIDIIAKPKGKKPLTINQLSGGEKTLTAISLLFAIYLLKPAPFCIFDEVDAPLDDANIDKFNTIIRKFANESQFIIVTHNKRTMASTDIIYGVTMVEQGVSRVVPVDLRELD